MPPPQGISYPINFLRQDNSYQDPITNNLVPANPLYPYSSIFSALFAAFGSAFWISVFSALGFSLRTKAAATYYVATNGNDANDGLTPATAWLTLTHAAAILFGGTLDFAGQTVTLQAVAAHATFNDPAQQGLHLAPWTGGGSFIFDGGGGSIAAINDGAVSSVSGPLPGIVTIQNVALSATGTPGNVIIPPGCGVIITGAAKVNLTGVSFGACNRHVQAAAGALISILSNYSINAGAAFAHWVVSAGGTLVAENLTITTNGTINFFCFAFGNSAGLLVVDTNTFKDIGGGVSLATGSKFNVVGPATILTNNAGVDYLPGSTPGISTPASPYQ